MNQNRPMAEPVDEEIFRLAELLDRSRRILVFTGAGISTASGIPDYRGPNGVWKTSTPIYYQTFMRDPEARLEAWQRGAAGRAVLAAAEPNAVHHAVADLERSGKVELVVTQNIDGLHRDAGTQRIVEIHGTTREIECQSCGERTDPKPHFDAFAATGVPPSCHCGGILKSATISFGQQLRSGDVGAAFAAADCADLVVALGSTLSVTPASDVPLTAARRGVDYAIVNRGETEHDGLPLVTLRIEGDVGEVFPAAVAAALS
jgi:NAD-dependent protein deacetylase/lipoamidase